MSLRGLIVLLLFSFLFLKGFSQTVSGTITDAQTNEPLPFVNVYISNTTKGTQTDIKGGFTLKLQRAGFVKVVCSMVGYKTFEQDFVLRPDEVRRLTIRLQTDTQFLNEVKVSGKRDKQWKKLYKDFERDFLGRTKNARECKILNPYEIDIKKRRQIMTASAIPALDIENKSLGYGLSYQLEAFESTPTSYKFSGRTLFRLLIPADESETQVWNNNRNQAYSGSLRHFLAAVVNKRSREEGFRVYLDAENSEKISRNRYFKNNTLIEVNPDTLARRDAVMQRVVLPNRRYEIHYLNRPDPQNWYFDINREVTWLSIKGSNLAFSYHGILENSYQLETNGSMGKRRVADFLPDDYQPSDAPTTTQFDNTGLITGFQKQEKICLHLGQNGYAAGDTIHYQIDVIDATTHNPVRQTLLYLTIRSQNRLIEQQKLWVDAGTFKGQWIIPDSLPENTYQLIVHNQWSRNFDEHFWARKNIEVVSNRKVPNQLIDSLQVTFFPESGHLVAGLSNRIGVTSFTKSGLPMASKGWLMAQNADTLAFFQSDEKGYGSFYFAPPTNRQPLKAVLSNGSVFSFPQALPKGYIIQTEVLKDTATVTIKIINNLLPTEWKPMRLWVHLRGQILYEAIVTPQKNLTIARIPREDLEGTGVMQIALLNALNQPIATSAFYQPPQSDESKLFDSDLFEAELYGCRFPFTLFTDERSLLKQTDLLLLTHKIRPYYLEDTLRFLYQSGMNITGKITQLNGKPITNTPVVGFINTDSTQLHFELKTDELGHFSTQPFQFYGKADVVVQLQSEKFKAVNISLDTLAYTPPWLWMPTVPLKEQQKDSLNWRLEHHAQAKDRREDKGIVSDFRRHYPLAQKPFKIEDTSQKLLPFTTLIEVAVPENFIIKADGVYVDKTLVPLFVDGLPTAWESLKALRGYEIEVIDVHTQKKIPDNNAINVLLRPESNFLSEQLMKRFVVTGLLKNTASHQENIPHK